MRTNLKDGSELASRQAIEIRRFVELFLNKIRLEQKAEKLAKILLLNI